jgi:2-iminobutanoate/2-iminopropanoate deaminase
MKHRLIQLAVLVTVILAGYSVAQQPRSDAPHKRVIQPAGSRPSTNLSLAIMVGDTLYMSGSIGSDPATGQLAKGGFEPELRQSIANAQAVLKAAGMDLSDVVAVTAYLADMNDFPRFNEVYKEYFKTEPLPTRSTVAVKDLARGARVELTMTAVRSH